MVCPHAFSWLLHPPCTDNFLKCHVQQGGGEMTSEAQQQKVIAVCNICVSLRKQGCDDQPEFGPTSPCEAHRPCTHSICSNVLTEVILAYVQNDWVSSERLRVIRPNSTHIGRNSPWAASSCLLGLQEQQQQSQEEQRRMMLAALLQPAARERCELGHPCHD